MGCVVNATHRPLYPRGKRPGTHCIGGCVGPRTCLDMCGISRFQRDSIPRPSSPQRVAIPTGLSRPISSLQNTVFTVSFLEVKNTHPIFGEADDGVEVAHDEDVYYWCLVAEERHKRQPSDHGVPQSDNTVIAASSEQVQRPLQVETANTLAHTNISRSTGVHQRANTLAHTDISRSTGVHQKPVLFRFFISVLPRNRPR